MSATSNGNRSLSERISDKIIALIWVVVAALTFKYTNTGTVLFSESSSAVSILLKIAAVGFGINTVLTLYLTLYLPLAKGLTSSDAWAVYCPRVIPTMTAVGLVTGLLLIRAVWPAYGFLSPLILAIEGLGLLFALQFIPWPC